MKRLHKVKIEWSSSFAFAIGIIATDGNLSPDGRHMNVTSKDNELITNFKKALHLQNKIGKKARGGSTIKKYFVVQFGDKSFYEFLLTIGLMPAKSKVIGSLKIRSKYFSDFLRGCLDGDGNINVFRHPESRHPQLRFRLCSASHLFLEWLRSEIRSHFKVRGGWIENKTREQVLCYGKNDSIKILHFIYNNAEIYLNRKYKIAEAFLGTP